MKCAKCGKQASLADEQCDCELQRAGSKEVAASAEAKTVLQVKSANGVISTYEDFSALKEAMVHGQVLRSMFLRVVQERDRDKEGDLEGTSWQTIEELAKGNSDLEVLYRPVWATAKKFILYGIITCVALKALDTTILFFQASPPLGIAWLITIGSMFIKKWWGPAFAIYFTIKAGIAMNLFGAALGVGVVGTLFGVPLGMLIGTVAGYWKSRHIALAQDAVSEGRRPLVYGLAMPSIALVALAWFYLYWLMPRLVTWLA
jgi:hypothetical protein